MTWQGQQPWQQPLQYQMGSVLLQAHGVRQHPQALEAQRHLQQPVAAAIRTQVQHQVPVMLPSLQESFRPAVTQDYKIGVMSICRVFRDTLRVTHSRHRLPIHATLTAATIKKKQKILLVNDIPCTFS